MGSINGPEAGVGEGQCNTNFCNQNILAMNIFPDLNDILITIIRAVLMKNGVMDQALGGNWDVETNEWWTQFPVPKFQWE
jgi:hypothetical protein